MLHSIVHIPARQSARPACVACSLLVLAVGLAGCGGGGSSVNNSNPGQTASVSVVSGNTTDINGAPIVGAAVTIAGQTVTSTQNGNYVVQNVNVPASQNSVVLTVSASKTINGRSWSGLNTVEVLNGQANTSNTDVVMSDNANQGTLTGFAADQNGVRIGSARVFVAPGPVVDATTNGAYFTNFSSFTTYTDQNGNYTISKLPAGTAYTVSASFAGYLNYNVSNVTISAGQTTTLNATLDQSTNSPVLSPVADFAAQCFTVPITASRSVGGHDMSRAYTDIKNYLQNLQHLGGHRFAASNRVTMHTSSGRSTPSGSLIETDLFWDYTQYTNLYGYDIVRSTGDATHFQSIATLRDPLGDRFTDLDPVLTPGTNYFYSVARLDTINFPNNSTASESAPAGAIEVDPLVPISETTPTTGATVSATPTLSWTAVTGAGYYEVLIYNRFPDYQSDTDPNGVQPVITPPTANAPATSLTLSSPLSSGTYYWAVLAVYQPSTSQSTFGPSYSISQIGTFVVP